MRIRLERSLAAWSKESGFDYHDEGSRLDLDLIKRNGLLESIRNYGFSLEAATSAATFFGQHIESGFAAVPDLSVLAWYWPNGEQIIYPINDSGTIYIGNSPEFWFDFYPFLRRLSAREYIYECCLERLSGDALLNDSCFQPSLYIGGQTHFGHFVVDKLAPLLSLSEVLAKLDSSFSSYVVPSGHHGVTSELLTYLMSSIAKSRGRHNVRDMTSSNPLRIELPKVNGIVRVGRAIVPSDNHHPNSLADAQQHLSRDLDLSSDATYNRDKRSRSSKIGYVSRFKAGSVDHDRIANYTELTELLHYYSCDHVFPTSLSLQERRECLSKYDLIISDSGSCCLNAIIFGSEFSRIYQIQSNRLLADASDLATSQHYKSISLIGKRLFSLSALPIQMSTSNTWYDKVDVDLPGLKSVIESFDTNSDRR